MAGISICAVADIHGDVGLSRLIAGRANERCDVLVVAGDLAPWGDWRKGVDAYAALSKFSGDIVVVLGNSDPPELLEGLRAFSQTVVLLEDSTVISGVAFAGVSGASPEKSPSLYPVSESELYERLKLAYLEALRRNPEVVVTISHVPPYGVLDRARTGQSIGSEGIRRFVEEMGPTVHICGHVHEAAGVAKLGSTLVVNASTYERRSMFIVKLGEGRLEVVEEKLG
ncbi:MAG: metallophosphoesterase [Thermoproteota archaeon]